MTMKTEGYKADRKAIYEAVKFWKGSPLYREGGLQVEGEQITIAPWMNDISEETESDIVTRWASVNDLAEDSSFEDVAAEIAEGDVHELLSYLVQEEEDSLIEAVMGLLEDNEGSVLYIGRANDTQAFALTLSEGRFYVSEMALETPLLDEGLISMTLLAQTVPDPEAPVVPGFAPIEQRIYEMLHAVSMVMETVDNLPKGLVEGMERFLLDASDVLVEMMADCGSLRENEVTLIAETFAGAYAGLIEEAKPYAN
jgi:hypothetical protein